VLAQTQVAAGDPERARKPRSAHWDLIQGGASVSDGRFQEDELRRMLTEVKEARNDRQACVMRTLMNGKRKRA
jgi:hypothetical protein